MRPAASSVQAGQLKNSAVFSQSTPRWHTLKSQGSARQQRKTIQTCYDSTQDYSACLPQVVGTRTHSYGRTKGRARIKRRETGPPIARVTSPRSISIATSPGPTRPEMASGSVIAPMITKLPPPVSSNTAGQTKLSWQRSRFAVISLKFILFSCRDILFTPVSRWPRTLADSIIGNLRCRSFRTQNFRMHRPSLMKRHEPGRVWVLAKPCRLESYPIRTQRAVMLL